MIVPIFLLSCFRFKAELALKHRKAAAQKKKEAEKREIETSSRKNLAGIRVVQKNLVYIIGLNPTIRDEAQLLQTLRGEQYFGQYGEIEKIVVSKARPGVNANQGIGVYVTFARKADAATCIAAVDGSPNGDRILRLVNNRRFQMGRIANIHRAQYGTTKYCSAFLRNEQCNNRNCTFLHETGEDNDSFSRQDLSSLNSQPTQRATPTPGAGPSYPPGHNPSTRAPVSQTQQSVVAPQILRHQSSKDDGMLRRGSADTSALPSSASWANREANVPRARRPSLAAGATPSPQPAPAALASEPTETPKKPEAPRERVSHETTSTNSPASQKAATPVAKLKTPYLDQLFHDVNAPSFRFLFSAKSLNEDEIRALDDFPPLIDPYGGAKRRNMREKEARERAAREAEAQALLQAAAANEEESHESGSLQLGGEPDDANEGINGLSRNASKPKNAIQPPSQQGHDSGSLLSSPASLHQTMSSLSINARSLTPQQQQQLMLLKSVNVHGAGTFDQLQQKLGQTSLESQARNDGFVNQMGSGGQGHTRQSSRYSFASDTASKNMRMPGAALNPLTAPVAQQQFFSSSVQGPPPGLKTAGTPPISGGGMFAQGHGFTSGMNLNKENNPDLLRELMRSRGAAGSASGHDASKREYLLQSVFHNPSPPPLAPSPGLLHSLYGYQLGASHEPSQMKQKKKGKKHRNANTTSGGGGVVDLADPSILQARMHQSGTGAGQGLYGSQGSGGYNNPSSMVYGAGGVYGRW